MATKRQRRAVRKQTLEQRVENILVDKLGHFLADISFRIGQQYELAARNTGQALGTVYAEDLNLGPARASLTGYAVTNNSPAAGSIAWTDVHIVYAGTDYVITNGNTALKYAWWSPTVTNTVLQTSNTKPALAVGEILLFMNTAGIASVMLSDTNSSMPKALADGTVDSGAILAKAVTTGALADLAVGSGQLGANAVVSGKIADGAVNTAAKLADNVVTGTKILDGAVGGTKITDLAITSAKVADGAVTSTKLVDDAVTNAKIAPLAVGSTELVDDAVTTAKIAASAVTTTELGTGAVTSTKIAGGSVDASKTNLLRHLLY